ncbi:MAG: hypothetical protein IPO21_15940 [Bacteroidales bacterium]|nr:hypothetical protein [Bacteroidales bacterium]
MKFNFFLVVLFVLSVFASSAQEKDSLVLVHYYQQDKGMMLKWLPVNFSTFAKGFEKGYNIYRADVKKTADGGEVLSDFLKLNAEPLKQIGLETLKEKITTDTSLKSAYLFIAGAQDIINPPVQTSPLSAVEQSSGQGFVALMSAFVTIQSNAVAEAIGHFWLDKSYIPTEKYVYRIELVANPKIVTNIIVFPFQKTANEKIMGLSADLEKGAIALSWYKNNNKNFPYFNIYRSENPNKNFVKLNKLPFTGIFGDARSENETTTFIDSFPEYNKMYYYKVVGINAFEAEGIPSDVVAIESKYLLQGRPKITKTFTVNDSDILIEWNVYPEDLPYIKGYTIKRANRGAGVYKTLTPKMLPAKDLKYTDVSKKQNSNYYVVCAYGQAGDSICSLLYSHLLDDSIPPSVPKFVYGICDTLGIVTLKWNKPPEEDVLGYRLFKTYDKSFEPRRILPGHIKDTFYVDTISLKEPYNQIYYTIAAIDNRANPSAPSDFFIVKIPDNKPPSNGFLKKFEVSKQGIHLFWANSSVYDLKKMHLLRKKTEDVVYDTIFTTEGEQLKITEFLDTLTRSNTTYDYTLVTEDESGLYSEHATTITAKQYKKETIASVKGVQAFVSRENRMIKLVWEYPSHATGFKIYRSANNEPLQTYQFAEGSTREFFDKRIKPNTTYTYMIVAELQGGYTSLSGEKVTVVY